MILERLSYIKTFSHSTRKIIALTASSFAVSLMVFLSGILGVFELKAYDRFSRYLNPKEAPGNIVIVRVDQESIDELSKEGITWPWPRQIYAPIVEYLSQADAVFMDILFTEPSSYGEEDDAVFGEAIRRASNVYLPLFLSLKEGDMSSEEEGFIRRIAIKDRIPTSSTFNSAVMPVKALRNSIEGAGNVTISPDEDGVYRRVPLLFGFRGYVIPNFVLSYLVKKGIAEIKGNSIYVKGAKIPLTDGKLMLRYYRKESPFRVFSVHQILKSYLDNSSGSVEPSIKRGFFRGKVVFIGLTAAGLYDLKPTSISSVSTGVLIHATTLDNIMKGDFIRPLNGVFVIFFMLVICLSISFSVIRSHSLLKNLSLFLVFLSLVLLITASLFKAGLYMSVIPPAASLIVGFMVSVAYSYATEGRQRLFLRATFSQYMDKRIANYLIENPSLIRPGGQIRRVTVFFVDLAGFTSFAEATSAERVAYVLHRVLNSLTEVLILNQGVIDKYIGDSIMAFWGAPFDTDRDEINACRSAIQCMEALHEINKEFSGEGFSGLKARIGIHSGEAIVGNIGSDRLFHYTVIGDTVNLASRLESVNKFFGTSIILSEDTLKETGETFYTRDLGSIAVKGKTLPVRIFELICERERIEPDRARLLRLFHEAMAFYRENRWSEAARIFEEVLSEYPDDGPSAFYRSRCEYIISNPHLTDDWNVIKFTEK